MLLTIISKLLEILKIELIDNSLRKSIPRCRKEKHHRRIRLGPIIRIIGRRNRLSRREIHRRRKVMEAQRKSRLFSNLQLTTFLKEKQHRVKHFPVITLEKTTNKQHLFKILLSHQNT